MKSTGVSGLKIPCSDKHADNFQFVGMFVHFFAAHHAKHGKKQKNRIKHKFSLANGTNIVYTLAVLTRGYYRMGY